MEFDWHDEKDAKVRAERGYGFADAIAIFAGRTVEWQDTRNDYNEIRMIAVGEVDGDFFTIVYTDRGDTPWIITSWPSHRKERAKWQRPV